MLIFGNKYLWRINRFFINLSLKLVSNYSQQEIDLHYVLEIFSSTEKHIVASIINMITHQNVD